jgi:hypothetical protein
VILSFRLRDRDYLTCETVTAAAFGIAQKGLWPLFIDPVTFADMPPKIARRSWHLLFGLFGGQRPRSIVNHSIRFVTKHDSFCPNVIRNHLNDAYYLDYLDSLNFLND